MQTDQWAVAYAKICVDKSNGIEYIGLYFGGIAETDIEADNIARECVNSIKGGTVLPKVYKLSDEYTLIDAMYTAADKFEQMIAKMQEANDIINKGGRK